MVTKRARILNLQPLNMAMYLSPDWQKTRYVWYLWQGTSSQITNNGIVTQGGHVEASAKQVHVLGFCNLDLYVQVTVPPTVVDSEIGRTPPANEVSGR